MSESRVEELLSQMTLAEPSSELDSRFMALMNQPASRDRMGRLQTARPWVLPTVAAVSLLIGVAIGHRSSVAAIGDETNTASSHASGQRTRRDTRESSGTDWNPAVEDQHVDVAAPKISILCAARREESAVTEQQQCSACHAGLHEERKFGDGVVQVHRIHRHLCARCHDKTRNWEKQEVHGALFGPEDPAPQDAVPGDA